MLFCESSIHNFTSIDESFRRISRPDCCEGKPRARAGRIAHRPTTILFLIALLCLPILMTGCTSAVIGTPSSDTGPFRASPGVVTFGEVPVGQTAVSSVALINQTSAPVQVSNVSVSGKSFALTGAEEMPITVAAGGTFNLTVDFSPSSTGAALGELTIKSDAANDGSVMVNLSGTGTIVAIPALSTLTCASGTINGAGTDRCTVTLSAPAPSGGETVSLASSNISVSVPASVTVAAGATSAGFVATVTAVNAQETVTRSANVNGVSQSFFLQLDAVIAALNVSTTNLSFGNVAVNSAAAQPLTLVSSGTEAVTVNAAAVSGAGFSISGANFPLTLPPGQKAALSVQFNPPAAGPAAGQLTLTSNSDTAAATVVNLSGTGTITNPSVLSGLSCASNAFTGTGSDSCTVTLTGPAGNGGLTFALASNNTAVAVPATVTVAAGASGAGFVASVSAVTSLQTATITASAGGESAVAVLTLNAAAAVLSASVASVAFGNVNVNTTATQQVTLTSSGALPVTIGSLSIAGSGFSVSGLSVPVSLNPNQSIGVTVQFTPTAAGAVTGILTLASNAAGGGTLGIGLSGAGTISILPTLSSFTCAAGSLTGSASDACTVTLSGAAPGGGLTVNLTSSAAAVTVPAAVGIPQGASSASFTAAATSVTTTQTVILTASAGSVSQTFAIQLGASSSLLNVSATSVNFGEVALNNPSTQTVALSTSATSPVLVSLATVLGAGFSLSGASFPLTITAGQPAALNVAFDPTVLGSSTGTLTIVTVSVTNPVAVISLSGTGVAVSYEVNLAWTAPGSSPDPVAGYNVYRSSDGGNTYQLLNSSPATQTAYVDTTVQDGVNYDYIVKSVDASGVESVPSNVTPVAIP